MHGGPTSPRDSKERTLQSFAISADETPISETELIMAFVLTQGTGQTRRQSAARGKGRSMDSQCEKKKKKKKEGVNWLKAAGSLGSSGTVIVSGPESKEGACENLHVCAWVNARTTDSKPRIPAPRRTCVRWNGVLVEVAEFKEIILFAFYRWSV